MLSRAPPHAAWAAGCDVKLQWIDSEHLERSDDVEPLVGLDGIVVPGGFGYRGIEGKVGIIHLDRHIDTQEKDMDEIMHTCPWFHATNIPNCPPTNLVQVGGQYSF